MRAVSAAVRSEPEARSSRIRKIGEESKLKASNLLHPCVIRVTMMTQTLPFLPPKSTGSSPYYRLQSPTPSQTSLLADNGSGEVIFAEVLEPGLRILEREYSVA
ncbi:hypothetical protein L596_000732 [Steinernema carpocapsae]|uniref:Uncharacterized protein n=1 Tax=Steinernema carpocapsae TaxID=34508 RepID=A0A4U8UJB4_STECR|nr:hypothetical protein L596_000732 [Steinernema carpocapsae]